MSNVNKNRLVFIDGSGLRAEPRPLTGLAPRGQEAKTTAEKAEKYDIIAITETWLSDNILDSGFNISGYTFLRKDNDLYKSQGGGLVLLAKNEITVVERSDLDEALFPQSIWCNILAGDTKTLLGVCYRSPDSQRINNEAMFSLLTSASQENVVILGDFNILEIKWDQANTKQVEHPLY